MHTKGIKADLTTKGVNRNGLLSFETRQRFLSRVCWRMEVGRNRGRLGACRRRCDACDHAGGAKLPNILGVGTYIADVDHVSDQADVSERQYK